MRSALLLAAACGAGLAAADDNAAIYEARAAKCDYFVSTSGDDGNDGTDLQSPFKTLKCALDTECNRELQTGEVVCLLAGVHEISETVYIKGASMREKTLTIMALGEARSTVLDGFGQVSLLNMLQTTVTFDGIAFINGNGASGGAVYGERDLHFNDCLFQDNEASVHGGAVMGGRNLSFKRCTFKDNQARFAGAVRVNDLGSATIDDCLFIGNKAEGRGGALITQIEKPENTVKVADTMFCFNESPMSPHIYNYRSLTHECARCKFNSRDCCSKHGRVVSVDSATNYVVPEGASRSRVCQCEAGWTGEQCESEAGAAAAAPKTEL